MGVYIKGMEMPTSCRDCPFYIENRHDRGDDSLCRASGREAKFGCPLFPVPPHGDLIDRDAMYKAINDARKEDPLLADVYVDDYVIVSDWLRNAPTIIPAEEGE